MGVCDVPVISSVCDAVGEGAATLVSAPFDWLAATMGSTAFHGDEPWPPRPSTWMLRLSEPAISGPLR